jgi:hypothetical protein
MDPPHPPRIARKPPIVRPQTSQAPKPIPAPNVTKPGIQPVKPDAK